MNQSGYLILTTVVALGMGIIDGKILLYNGISEQIKDNKITTRDYNNRTVYDCFNNPFPSDYGSPYLNLTPIRIDDSTHPDKRAL